MENIELGHVLFADWVKADPRKQHEIAAALGTNTVGVARWKTGDRIPSGPARVAIELVTGGAVPRDVPWSTPTERKDDE